MGFATLAFSSSPAELQVCVCVGVGGGSLEATSPSPPPTTTTSRPHWQHPLPRSRLGVSGAANHAGAIGHRQLPQHGTDFCLRSTVGSRGCVSCYAVGPPPPRPRPRKLPRVVSAALLRKKGDFMILCSSSVCWRWWRGGNALLRFLPAVGTVGDRAGGHLGGGGMLSPGVLHAA